MWYLKRHLQAKGITLECVFCGQKDWRYWTIDHIKPRSRGGDNRKDNLQILCGPCNVEKGSKYPYTKKDWLKDKEMSKLNIGALAHETYVGRSDDGTGYLFTSKYWEQLDEETQDKVHNYVIDNNLKGIDE